MIHQKCLIKLNRVTFETFMGLVKIIVIYQSSAKCDRRAHNPHSKKQFQTINVSILYIIKILSENRAKTCPDQIMEL